VKIVALTASAFMEQRKRIIEVGCDEVVHKPYRAHEVFDAMAEHLGVSYIYEKEEKPPAPSVDLTVEMLHQLPSALREELASAAHSLSIDDSTEVIERISSHDAVVADSLQRLVANFQFNRILELLHGVDRK